MSQKAVTRKRHNWGQGLTSKQKQKQAIMLQIRIDRQYYTAENRVSNTFISLIQYLYIGGEMAKPVMPCWG